ncbi:MAG: hypothetical protein PVH25_05830 [Burkholderiales bacterium]|jgi:protein-S-isoprenylcysteine O-methyltransferase Ste14
MSTTGKLLSSVYALLAYVIGMASLLWLIGFLINVIVPKTVDAGPSAPLPGGYVTNAFSVVAYLALHSVMARPGFKAWWTRIIPVPVERATYVLIAGATTFLLIWIWRPMPATVWRVESPALAMGIHALYGSGWLMMVVATFNIDHWSFFGLRQVWEAVFDHSAKTTAFTARFLYGVVRHPISLGWLIVFWATPHMSVGHLLMAVCVSVYIAVVTPIEESDLAAELGEDYANYRKRVRAILPWPRR